MLLQLFFHTHQSLLYPLSRLKVLSLSLEIFTFVSLDMNCGLSLYVAEHLIRSNLLSADRNQRFIDLPPRIYTPLGRLEDIVMNNDENTNLV